MANFCVVYVQLFAGWGLLCAATLALDLLPHSALFFDLSGEAGGDAQLWTYLMWVLVQVLLFFTLLIMATVLMCSCPNMPQDSGFVHVLVDPALVTLGCVPFLLITGIPRANFVENCLLNTTPPAVLRHERQVNLTNLDFHPLLEELPYVDKYYFPGEWTPTQCLYSQFYWTVNSSQVASLFDGGNVTLEDAQELLSQWKIAIEMSVVLPVTLHFLHYHWHMAWGPFLQANLYLLLQALDIVFFIDTAIYVSDPNIKLLTETVVYISVLVLCAACLSLSTPPMYIGNSVSKDYLRIVMSTGTIVVDAINMIIRITLLFTQDEMFYRCNQALFYILLLKNLICTVGLIYYFMVRSPCIEPEYNSLATQELDPEEEKEDFV